jgi:hypothetical protein
MKFDVALKDVKIGDTAGRLERTDRLYPCGTCRKVTGWRLDVGPDNPGSPMCSDECLDAWDAYKSNPYADLVVPGATPPTV